MYIISTLISWALKINIHITKRFSSCSMPWIFGKKNITGFSWVTQQIMNSFPTHKQNTLETRVDVGMKSQYDANKLQDATLHPNTDDQSKTHDNHCVSPLLRFWPQIQLESKPFFHVWCEPAKLSHSGVLSGRDEITNYWDHTKRCVFCFGRMGLQNACHNPFSTALGQMPSSDSVNQQVGSELDLVKNIRSWSILHQLLDQKNHCMMDLLLEKQQN